MLCVRPKASPERLRARSRLVSQWVAVTRAVQKLRAEVYAARVGEGIGHDEYLNTTGVVDAALALLRDSRPSVFADDK